jgi:hypothetical protein
MKAIISKFSNFYIRFEKYISAVGLIYGFIFTTLTLTRVDAFLENFWIVFHLVLAGFGIAIITLFENKNDQKFHFYLTLLIQFAFGGLFSTFFVFYMRSSSVAESWLFLLILIVLLVGNELWKKHYTRLAFQVSVLFVSIYLFLIFLLPVIFHRLGTDLFIASGILSLIIIFFFTKLLRKIAVEKFRSHHNILRTSILSIFVIMNIMYFTDIMPPIPLSLKDAGVYHSIVRNKTGNYDAKVEPKVWRDYFNRFPVFHRVPGQAVYVFSAIFSPVKFATETVHQWQYYDESKKAWIDSSRIALPIIGGRDGGFRTYSVRYAVTAGLWRVKVMTTEGKVIGRINFRIKDVDSSELPALNQVGL